MLAVKLILCHPGPWQNRRTGRTCKSINVTPFTHSNRSSDFSKTGFQGVSGLQVQLLATRLWCRSRFIGDEYPFARLVRTVLLK
jgi:hypothetical protein